MTFWTFSARVWVKLAPIRPKKIFASFLSPSPTFYDTFAQACAEIKFWDFWVRKLLTSSALQIFNFFFAFPFYPFLIFLRQWLTFHLACFQLKFVHVSASSEPITLICVSVWLKRSFPSAELEYRLCQLWSKVMTSELEQRLVTAGYGWHGNQ